MKQAEEGQERGGGNNKVICPPPPPKLLPKGFSEFSKMAAEQAWRTRLSEESRRRQSSTRSPRMLCPYLLRCRRHLALAQSGRRAMFASVFLMGVPVNLQSNLAVFHQFPAQTGPNRVNQLEGLSPLPKPHQLIPSHGVFGLACRSLGEEPQISSRAT